MIPWGNGMPEVCWTGGRQGQARRREGGLHRTEASELALLTAYTKAERANILPKDVKRK